MGFPGIKVMIGLTLALFIGLICLLAGCAIKSNWWPLLTLIGYIGAPIPNMLFGSCQKDSFGDLERSWKDFGYFLTSIFTMAGIAIPLILFHVGTIEWLALLLSLVGGVIIYGALLFFYHKFAKEHNNSDDSF